tara:strand:- start:4506 stop:5633 length:1128 start_codon:yes stop_codon:yes gene_type:complete
MPSDVSGTIHIIAEVMGAGPQNPGAAGQIVPSSDENDNATKWGWIKGLQANLKTIQKIIGIGGILTQSKILSSSFSSILRILGALVDVILAPLMPFFVRGINVLSKVVNFMRAFMSNPVQALKDAWAGLVTWFKTTWEEKGGFWGVIKDATANITGVLLVGTLFGVVTGLFSPAWIANKIWGLGNLITRGALTKALGLAKTLVESATTATKSALAKAFKWTVLTPARFFGRLFKTAFLFTTAYVRKALGLAVEFGAKPAGKLAWKALLWGSAPITWTALKIASMLGLGTLFAGVTLFGLAMAGLVVGTIAAFTALGIFFEWAWNRNPLKDTVDNVLLESHEAVATGGDNWYDPLLGAINLLNSDRQNINNTTLYE